MTQTPSPLHFRPINAHLATISNVADLTTEQVSAITAPLNPNEKPQVVATLQTFNVTVDLSGVALPEKYRTLVHVWVKGSAASFAAISYNPVPTKPLKSGLWRLTPDVTGGSADNTNTVSVSLPQAYPVARLHASIRGLFDPAALPA